MPTKIRKTSASMSAAPGVGTSVNVKSPSGVCGRRGGVCGEARGWGDGGVGLEIDKCIEC